MPAKHPRLTITMQPRLHALLRRLSELTGQSQSALIFELLDGAQPVLGRVISLLEASNEAKAQMRGKLALDMGDAQRRIEQQLGLGLEVFEGQEDVRDLLHEAESVSYHRARSGTGQASRRTVPRSAPAAVEPPASNRGVRSLTKIKKTTKAKGGKS